MLNTRFTTHLAILGFVLFLGCAALTLYTPTYPGDITSPRYSLSLSLANNAVSFSLTSVEATSYPASFSTIDMDATTDELTILSLHSSVPCSPRWHYTVEKDSIFTNTTNLTVIVYNTCPYSIKVGLNIGAPDFRISPDNPIFSVAPNGENSQTLQLTPQNVCLSYSIVIDINAEAMNDPSHPSDPNNPKSEEPAMILDTSVPFQISLSETFSIQTLLQLLSNIGTFLGSMLTLPWWYEQWQKHKDKKKDAYSPKATSRLRKNRTRSKKRR